jgi:hypothetical protein
MCSNATMIQPLWDRPENSHDTPIAMTPTCAARFNTQLGRPNMKSTHPILDTGSVDATYKHKVLSPKELRRDNPLIKPLISGSVDESHKSNERKELRQPIHCPSLVGNVSGRLQKAIRRTPAGKRRPKLVHYL